METNCSAVEKLREEFKSKIQQSVEYRYRALMALYEAQTAIEKAGKKTNILNGVGFDRIDAAELTRLAEKVKAGELLEDTEEAKLLASLPKYWGQFLRLQGLYELPGVGLKMVKVAVLGRSELKEAA
jgi:endonuclease III